MKTLLVAASSVACAAALLGAAPSAAAGGETGLGDPCKKEIAMRLVSSAENSSLDWQAQYRYIEDIDDGRGYTGGIIGFTSGTGDMLDVVRGYRDRQPENPLVRFIKPLRKVNGSDSHKGLGRPFVRAWHKAAKDTAFRDAQDHERDAVYFDPAVGRAEADGLSTLGQFVYYDAMVVHGPGPDKLSFGGIRKAARKDADTPADGGDEKEYLLAYFTARTKVMRTEAAHEDTTRIDTAQRRFLRKGNYDLTPPLRWKVYGDPYEITAESLPEGC